jgi:hypothetical protein
MYNLSDEEMFKCISDMVEDGLLCWEGLDSDGEPMLSLTDKGRSNIQ